MILKSGILIWEEKDQVGIIKISSAEPPDMISDRAFCDLDTIKEWTTQEHIQGIIVTGKNGHFSSGIVPKKLFDSEQLFHQFALAEEALQFLENLEKPVIAAIDGACQSVGLEIALSCHMRFCSQDAVFGFPATNYGISPPFEGIQRLVKTIGRPKAMEALLTGDTFGAERAFALGIVNGISDGQSCFPSVLEFTEKILSRGAKPVAYAIRAINNAGKMDFKKAAAAELEMFTELVRDKYQ